VYELLVADLAERKKSPGLAPGAGTN
jgi:hypothetical protein